MGSEVAVCTRATRVAEEVREVISQAAATFCIQVPTLEAKEAIHKALKSGSRSGAHAEEEGAACALATRNPLRAALCGDAQVPAGREHYCLGAVRLEDYLDVAILSLIKLLVGLFYLLKGDVVADHEAGLRPSREDHVP